MKKIYFATTNNGKFDYLSKILLEDNIKLIHVPLNLPELRSDNLQEIAEGKVLFAYNHIKKPCIATDSGFYIHSLNGFPKTFVNFALGTIGIEGMLKLAEGKPRECETRECLVYIDETLSEPVFFESITEGTLSYIPRGKKKEHHWSDIWLIFIPNNTNKTLAEMTFEENMEWRKQRKGYSFITKFAEWLSKK